MLISRFLFLIKYYLFNILNIVKFLLYCLAQILVFCGFLVIFIDSNYLHTFFTPHLPITMDKTSLIVVLCIGELISLFLTLGLSEISEIYEDHLIKSLEKIKKEDI